MPNRVARVNLRKSPTAIKDIASVRCLSEDESYLPGDRLRYPNPFGGRYGYRSWTHWLVVRLDLLRGDVCKESKGSQFSKYLAEVILARYLTYFR